MNKPNNYENVKTGTYTPPAVGGHHIIIKKVIEGKSKNNKPMITVMFDFAANDVQPDFFMNEFKEDTRDGKKWPRGGTAYIVTEDNDGNCSKSLKGFVTSFEKSNGMPEDSTQWGDKFAEQFTNKRIGGIFGEVENEYNGKRSMRIELRWFCADDKVDEATVPEPKRLPAASDDFMRIPDNAQDVVPWG